MGGRAGDGVDARHQSREILFLCSGREHRGAHQWVARQARRAIVSTAQGRSHDMFRRDGVFRRRRESLATMSANSFGGRATLKAGGKSYEIYRLDSLERRGLSVARLPYWLKILLENLLRREDGRVVRTEDIEKLARWDALKVPDEEIAFMPARVLLQDFTGVPAVVEIGRASCRERV